MNQAWKFSLALILGAFCSLVMAQEKTAPAVKAKPKAAKAMHVAMNESDIKWGDTPPELPTGAKMAVLEGNPGGTGHFTVRLKAGNGYKVPAHWHPTTENVTVISGTFVDPCASQPCP